MPGKPTLPPAVNRSYKSHQIATPGWWLVISDIHIPYHDKTTVELAIDYAKRQQVRGVLLNGDILDSHEISHFDKDPSAPRYIEEIESGKQFLGYLRSKLPKATVIWKDGNHEDRLQTYLMRRAPALFGLPGVSLKDFLEMEKHGIEWIGDKRVIRLGALNVIHGHEYTGPRVSAPVNAARGIFLRAKSVALCGHWHHTSEHHEPTINGKPQGAWSTGCACQLTPAYAPLNRWNHGFAMIELSRTGKEFSVRNLRVLDGQVV
jgi:predicted phosphodiesterase